MSDFYESQISDLEDHVKELEADKEQLRKALEIVKQKSLSSNEDSHNEMSNDCYLISRQALEFTK